MTLPCYKLLSSDMTSHGGFPWLVSSYAGPASCRGPVGGPGWFHAYSDPLLAAMLNPVHNNYADGRLFSATGAGRYRNDRGIKLGFERLRCDWEVPLPAVSLIQRVSFAILTCKQVCDHPPWQEWADRWIAGKRDPRYAIVLLMRTQVKTIGEINRFPISPGGMGWVANMDGMVAGRAALRAAIWSRAYDLWPEALGYEAAVAVCRAATVLNPDVEVRRLAHKASVRNKVLDLVGLARRAMEIGAD